jgi:GDP-fucose transporter C1
MIPPPRIRIPVTRASSVPTSLALFYGILSAFFIAIHSVLIKSTLPYVDGSALHLSYWTNLGSSIVLLPIVVVIGEASEFLRLLGKAENVDGELLCSSSANFFTEAALGSQWAWSTFLWGSLVTGVFGALLGLAGMLSVKATSPITHMFSSVSAV